MDTYMYTHTFCVCENVVSKVDFGIIFFGTVYTS